MTAPRAHPSHLESGFLLALVIVVSLIFGWLVMPFFGAIVWSVVAAIMFAPLNDRLVIALGKRRNLAAALTLLIILLAVILPALMLGGALLQEVTGAYARFRSGQIDLDRSFALFEARLPLWLQHQLEGYGLTDFDAVRTRILDGIAAGLKVLAAQALSIGQGAMAFLLSLGMMLYLSFFLIRDGHALARRVEHAIPLLPDQRGALLAKFAAVVRATIKGSLVVAMLQGLTGGLIFGLIGIGGALLWGVLMAAASLLPAIGTGLVWVPMALYLLATGAVWQGVVVALCGFFIIGSIDNLIKPILVGRDARMPDYLVLLSTFGGLELFGFNGLVVGPVIAAMAMVSWEIFAEVRAHSTG